MDLKTPIRTITEYADGTKTVINYTRLGEQLPEEPLVEPEVSEESVEESVPSEEKE